MAADGGPIQALHDPATAGLMGVIGTALLAWLGNRLVGKAAIQTAILEQFKELMEQLRTELRVAVHERDVARIEQTELEGELRQCQQIIDSQDRLMRRAGLSPPIKVLPPRLAHLASEGTD